MPFTLFDHCSPSFLILQRIKKRNAYFCLSFLLILLTNPWLFSNPFLWYIWLCLSVSLTPPPSSLPSLSIACFVSHFNEQLDSFISLQVLDLPYHPRSFEGCQLVLSMDVSFLRLPLFFSTKRKNHSVNKPLRSQRLKTSTSPTFQRYSQLVCVKLN